MYLPQLLSLNRVFATASPEIEGSIEFALLLSDIGLNVWDRGLSDSAKSLLKAAEKVLDSIEWDENSKERSDIYVLLGILTDTVGISQRAEGLSYRQKAHDIRKRHYDSKQGKEISLEEDIRYHNTVTDLACSHQQYNRYAEIEATCRQVIAKYNTWGSEDDFPYEHAKYYHHMAYVLVYKGNTHKAAEYALRASNILARGSFGLLATLFRFDCATILFQDGRVEEAINEHKTVLEIRLLKLGKTNPMTLHSYALLGIINYFNKDYENAEYVAF